MAIIILFVFAIAIIIFGFVILNQHSCETIITTVDEEPVFEEETTVRAAVSEWLDEFGREVVETTIETTYADGTVETSVETTVAE